MDFDIRFRGVCSNHVQFEMDDELIVRNVSLYGGCPGNTIGIAKLSEGMNADKIIAALLGIRCGFNTTSCPDQFAQALIFAKASIQKEKDSAF